MDQSSSRKRKGFKLVMSSIYRTQPQSASTNNYSTIPTGGGVVGTFMINREITTAPPPRQKVAFVGGGVESSSSLQFRRKFESIYGVPGDEKVDFKAETYISSVQERFRRDSLNSSSVECIDTTTQLVH